MIQSQALSDNHLVMVSCAIMVTAHVWEYLKWSLGSRNTVKFLEASDVIFIKNFTVFLLPKPDRKYSHTNCHIFAMIAITQQVIIAHSLSLGHLRVCWTVERVPIKFVNGTTY